MDPTAVPAPERCLLQNPVFTKLGTVTFRRAESDGTPVMLVPLGDKQAAMPLRAVQREFAIDDASPDGRMLKLIADALDFVAALQVGDMLPSEVLSGHASWEPLLRHRRIAVRRLHMQLLTWLSPEAVAEDCGEASVAERLESDPALRAKLQAAFAAAARSIGLPDAAAITVLVADIAEELAFIEALRESLLQRVEGLVERVDKLGGGVNVNPDRVTVLARVRRLARNAARQVASRFAEVDGQTGEVIATLRNIDSQRAFIRAHRDWLHSSGRAWEPILAEWQAAAPVLDDAAWQRLGRTYQFLAPRFMQVQEWLAAAAGRKGGRPKQPENIMRW